MTPIKNVEIPVKKAQLCEMFKEGETGIQNCILLVKVHLRVLMDDEDKKLRQLITGLKSCWNNRLDKCHRSKDKFEKKYRSWLDSKFTVPDAFINPIQHQVASERGRPSMSFDKKGLRAQQMDVAKIAQNQVQPTVPLLKATCRTVSKRGLKDTSFIIKQTLKSPGRSAKMRKILTEAKFKKSFTPEDALALLLDINLTTNQYIKLRKAIVQKGHKDVFPPYYKVKQAKANCRPPESKIEVTDASASVPLQELALHTAQRVVALQQEVVVQHQTSRNLCKSSANLICSWGFDGSTGQSQYKQKPSENHYSSVLVDSSLFATTMIPLRLISDDHKDPNKCTVLWQNPTPHSPRFCRPIQLEFAKETPELVLARKQQIERQIHDMAISGPTCFPLNGEHSIDVKFDFHLTLIDGKILNICTGTKSNQICPICSNPPLEFNKLENLRYGFKPNAGSLRFGASPLHAWIRFLECCLHISYRLEFKKWRVCTEEHKKLRRERKKKIKDWIQENMGIIVDQPKSGGSGNTNDGNTARRLFANYSVFASILGLNEELVHRFSTILIALNCQLPLNTEAFGKFCTDTARLYIKLYDWYPMPATVHKILVHGKDILESSILPVGVFSEEAPESCNKLYRRFRLNYSRKCSRKATMTDLFHRCIDNSDPLLSSQTVLSRASCRRRQILPLEVRDLLKEVHSGGRELFFEDDPLDWEPEQLLENCDFSLLDDEDVGEYDSVVDNAGVVMYEVEVHLDSLDDIQRMDQVMQL